MTDQPFKPMDRNEKTVQISPPTYLILVVDDIEANRDLLSRRLRQQGYAALTAENGQIALEILRARPFDLVILDIMMPVMDGYKALAHIKADEHLRHIPVIMMSAVSEMDSITRCIEMGADDYLTKPFNQVLLKARISGSIGKKVAHDREVRLYAQLNANYMRLKALEALRDDLTGMIIHDLRTPLASVLAGLRMLESVGELNEDQLEMRMIALSGGETLLGMINDLLDVDKLESGTMELAYSDVLMSDAIEAAIAQVTALVQDKHLVIVRRIDADIPPVPCDRDKICRTLVNLLGNAIKFTPTGGTLTIEESTSVDQKAIQVAVSDTGEGIPTESFDRIFEKFGQVESRKSGRNMSTGLGLTFCKLTVEAHGGEIGVESVAGEGSRFWFTLPCRAPLRVSHPISHPKFELF